GEKGVGWDFADEGTLGIDVGQAVYTRIPNELDNQVWWEWGPFYKSASQRHGEAVDPDVPTIEGVLYEAGAAYEPYRIPEEKKVPPLMFTMDESGQVGETETNLIQHLEQFFAAIGTGRPEVDDDADWQEFQDGFTSIGLDNYLEIQQTAYDRQFGCAASPDDPRRWPGARQGARPPRRRVHRSALGHLGRGSVGVGEIRDGGVAGIMDCHVLDDGAVPDGLDPQRGCRHRVLETVDAPHPDRPPLGQQPPLAVQDPVGGHALPLLEPFGQLDVVQPHRPAEVHVGAARGGTDRPLVGRAESVAQSLTELGGAGVVRRV